MRLFLAFLMTTVIPAIAEPTTGRTCRIVFPARPKDAPTGALLFDGKASHQVSLPSMNFSEVITLPSGEITLLMTADEIKDPANIPSGAPELRIKATVKDFYILVSSDRTNPTLPLKMEMVTAGDGALKAGETLWTNLTDHRIQAKLGDISFSVEPGRTKVSSNPVPESGNYRAEFSYQAHAKGDYKRITEQQWWHDAGCRHVGFIMNTGGILPRICFFRDFR